MKVLVFGETGQVAREIARRAGDIDLKIYGRQEADFTDTDRCVDLIAQTDADAVINAVAYTAVDKAESEEELALKINATTPSAIAQACADRGLPLVHISTDYVFDGSGNQPFKVNQPVAPLGAYGRTKLQGEQGVQAAGGTYAVFRTSWVVSSHGNNFVKTMLRLGADRETLRVVADQVGGPTCAAAIADTCLAAARQLIAEPSKSGVFHLSGSPDVSWADFAREIFTLSGISCLVEGIPSSEYLTLAPRPLNSRLDNTDTLKTFGLARSDWRVGLKDILQDLGALKS
jgi:dTDP-4-dehydrorhamnose reductase